MGRINDLLSHMSEQMYDGGNRPFRGTRLVFHTDYVIRHLDIMIYGVKTTEFQKLTLEAAANLKNADFALEHIGVLIGTAVNKLKTEKIISDESELDADCLLLADCLHAVYQNGVVDFMLGFHVGQKKEMHCVYFHFPRDEKNFPQRQLEKIMVAAE